MGRRFQPLGLALTLGTLAVGCPESHTAAVADPEDLQGDAGADDGDGDAGGLHETRTVTTTIPAIEPGEERTVCRVLDLGNEAPAMVRAIRADLGPGSHHMIVYRTEDATTDTHSPCGSVPGGADTLLIAQRAATEVVYPEGAGLLVPARQHIRLEIHYMNYLGETTDLDAAVHFDLVPVDDSLDPVGVMFTGQLTLAIPARTEGHVIESFHPVPADRRIFALTTHTHHRGVYASLHRATHLSDPDATLLHESFDWAEPPLDRFEPPLVFDSGEGLRIRCIYDNHDDHTVTFGMGFDDEMCFLWAYWY